MANSENSKPLKRHPSLIALSKDHHHGLLLCFKIREGFKKNISESRITDYVKHFFDEHLEEHFREEEDILLPRLNPNDQYRVETINQHLDLFTLRRKMEDTESKDLLREFEKKLDAHIRFEERQLFEYMQNNLSEGVLKEIENSLPEKQFVESWEDRFWEK